MHDDDTFRPAREALGRLLDDAVAHDLQVGLAESMTAGLASYLLIDHPGAGESVRGSLVTYHTAVKRRLLHYQGPVVSAGCAAAMAVGACEQLGADLGLAFTGVAGPDRQEGHPPGTVFVGVALGCSRRVQQLALAGTPNEVRLAAIVAGAELARELVAERHATARADGTSAAR